MGATGQPIAGHPTERRQRRFATARSNFEAKTGRRLEQWVAIARRCPRDEPRARVEWLRSEHGPGVNHAALLGLKPSPVGSPRLSAPKRKEGWSERLTATAEPDRPADVDDEIARLFTAAAANGWNLRPRGAGTGRNT